ncbi:ABC transporter permease [Caenimonas sp. SL110]|uniref:ABC transporter permease n=1 Tax=Caenimonas sp. SL110 TaxID=1450524 RepID=UPI00065461EF|nr:ABC transporter permease [Caenimonas sp. SL110]
MAGVEADSPFDHQHVTRIEPPKAWRTVDWRELWAYRELLWVLTRRDIKVRYKQAVLGAGWAILRPVLTMVIFSVIFGHFAKIPSDGFPYPVFLYAALLPWTFFAGAIGSSANSLVGSAHLVSKIYFPRLIIPIASVGAGLMDLLVSMAILLLMMVWYGVGWSWNLLAAPLLILAVVFAALSVGALLSALTVAYRDFTQLTPFLVQLWMYVTPVIFPVSMVPERWRWLLYLNPMTGLVEGFRSVFLGKPFDLAGLAISMAIVSVAFVVAVAYFQKVERRFADII